VNVNVALWLITRQFGLLKPQNRMQIWVSEQNTYNQTRKLNLEGPLLVTNLLSTV